jgi:ABC-type dipeptide/oligopeptide/nickel transport system permease subunit
VLSNAQSYFVHSWWLVTLPGLAIFVTVLAANILGNAVRDALDPPAALTAESAFET